MDVLDPSVYVVLIIGNTFGAVVKVCKVSLVQVLDSFLATPSHFEPLTQSLGLSDSRCSAQHGVFLGNCLPMSALAAPPACSWLMVNVLIVFRGSQASDLPSSIFAYGSPLCHWASMPVRHTQPNKVKKATACMRLVSYSLKRSCRAPAACCRGGVHLQRGAGNPLAVPHQGT
jgi:hypothetical protein